MNTPQHTEPDAKWMAEWYEQQIPGSTLLVAVSGGLDSCCLWNLIDAAGLPYAVAHVNYGLRGAASNKDEDLVRSLAQRRNCTLHLLQDFSLLRQSNLQEQARRVRYQFFARLRSSYGYSYLATAHQANDQLETIHLALLRGSGPKRLGAMREVDRDYVRPLLGFSRAALQGYAEREALRWREDESNASDAYLRNRFRHAVAPALELLELDALRLAGRSARAMHGLIDFADEHLQGFGGSLKAKKFPHALSRSRLAVARGRAYFLHASLAPLSFGASTIADILSYVEQENSSRAVFESNDRKQRCVVAGSALWVEATELLPQFALEVANSTRLQSAAGVLKLVALQQLAQPLVWRTLTADDKLANRSNTASAKSLPLQVRERKQASLSTLYLTGLATKNGLVYVLWPDKADHHFQLKDGSSLRIRTAWDALYRGAFWPTDFA